MTVSTQGIELDSDSRVWRSVVELLSSNRKTMDGDKEFEMLKSRLLQERS